MHYHFSDFTIPTWYSKMKSRGTNLRLLIIQGTLKDLQRYTLDPTVSIKRRNLPCPRISAGIPSNYSTTEQRQRKYTLKSSWRHIQLINRHNKLKDTWKSWWHDKMIWSIAHQKVCADSKKIVAHKQHCSLKQREHWEDIWPQSSIL